MAFKVKNCEQIKRIFETMDYGDSEYPVQEAKEFLRNYEPRTFVPQVPSANKSNMPIEEQDTKKLGRSELLRRRAKFADEIEKRTELIVQLELLLRGFSPKETKHGLAALLEWLRKPCTASVRSCDVYFPKHRPLLDLALAFHEFSCEVIDIYVDNECSCLAGLLEECALKNESFKFRMHMIRGEREVREKAPMIVFNTADIDAACYCCLEATWGYQGLLAWSVGTVLVQEDVFEEFTENLKEKLRKVRMGRGGQFAYPSMVVGYAEEFQKWCGDARLLGVDVFVSNPEDDFSPCLLIGGSVYDNNVLEVRKKCQIPILTVLAFRNVSEAVALAKDCRNNVAATIWTENVGLANEVAGKLNVNAVWVNCHNQLSARMLDYTLHGDKLSLENDVAGLDKNWPKVSFEERRSRLFQLALGCEEPELSSKIIDTLVGCTEGGSARSCGKLVSTTFAHPIGLITIRLKRWESGCLESVIAALAQGNLVKVHCAESSHGDELHKLGKLMSHMLKVTAGNSPKLNGSVEMHDLGTGSGKSHAFDFQRSFIKEKVVWQNVGHTYC